MRVYAKVLRDTCVSDLASRAIASSLHTASTCCRRPFDFGRLRRRKESKEAKRNQRRRQQLPVAYLSTLCVVDVEAPDQGCNLFSPPHGLIYARRQWQAGLVHNSVQTGSVPAH